jgi:hypothetical protein
MVSAESVVSATTEASVAAASVDPNVAVARTNPAGQKPMVCLRDNRLKPLPPLPMLDQASSPASNKPRVALERKSHANAAPVAVTVDHVRNAASAMTGANAPSALNPSGAKLLQSTKRPRLSRANLTSQRAHPRQLLDRAPISP